MIRIEISNESIMVDTVYAVKIEEELNKIETMAKLLDYKIEIIDDYGIGMAVIFLNNDWTQFNLCIIHNNDEMEELSLEVIPIPHGKHEIFSSKDKENNFLYPLKKLVELL